MNIPNTVKVIGDSAFFGSNLTVVLIGTKLENECLYMSDNTSALTSIGKDAFSNIAELKQIDCWAVTPPALGEHVFDGIDCKNVKLRVPYQGEKAYKEAEQWKEFSIELLTTPPSEYTITFLNWDNSLLQEVQTPAGEIPQYTGATPTREADEEFTYTFKGWTPELIPAGGDATYIATYSGTPISEGVEEIVLDPTSSYKIIRDGQILILRNDKIYTPTGVEIE